MAATSNRIVAVNIEAPLLDTLRPLETTHGVEIVCAESEADLLAKLSDGQCVVALGLRSSSVSPLSALRALALTRTRPSVVLIGDVDSRLYQSIQRLATTLRFESLAHVSEADAGSRLLGSFTDQAQSAATPDEAELRVAIEEQQFLLHYQPKFACERDRTIVGVEALVRWNHPELGVLLPNQFLPIAEKLGLLMDITDFTITDAICQYSAWRARGIDMPVSINLASSLIRDDRFPDRLVNSFRQFDAPPWRFTLEVKESHNSIDRDLCADVFTRLRLAGVGIALDDYGAGQSSLTELYKLPFTELKLDRALVSDAPNSGDARIVMHAIVRLARELGISVCAEGVETQAELGGVLAAGCNVMQGRLFCEPQRPADLERTLNAMRTRYVATQPMNRAPADLAVAV